MPLLVVVSYLHAMVGVSKAQLSAHHHGLTGTPAFSTDQTPVLCSVSAGAQHFHTAFIACSTTCDTHLIRKQPKEKRSRKGSTSSIQQGHKGRRVRKEFGNADVLWVMSARRLNIT